MAWQQISMLTDLNQNETPSKDVTNQVVQKPGVSQVIPLGERLVLSVVGLVVSISLGYILVWLLLVN